jgi:hypothetical protein
MKGNAKEMQNKQHSSKKLMGAANYLICCVCFFFSLE